jgi:hypothetical protein
MSAHKQPPQSQKHPPGRESEMTPRPEFQPRFRGAEKLMGKVVVRQGAYAAAVHYVSFVRHGRSFDSLNP